MLLVATPRTTKSLMQSMLLGTNTGGGFGTAGVNKKVTKYGVFQTHGGTGYRDDATLLPALGVPSDQYGVFQFCVFYCADTSCTSVLIQAGGNASGSSNGSVLLNSGGTLTVTANGDINTTTAPVVGAGLHCLVFGNDRANSRQELWLDGALIQTWASGAQTGFPFDYLRTGQSSGGNISIGLVGTGLGRGATYGNFAKSLNNNPWQLFKVPRRVLRAASGGNPALTGNAITSSAGTANVSITSGILGAPLASGQGSFGVFVAQGITGSPISSLAGSAGPSILASMIGTSATFVPGSVSAPGMFLAGSFITSAFGSLSNNVTIGLVGQNFSARSGMLSPLVPAFPGRLVAGSLSEDKIASSTSSSLLASRTVRTTSSAGTLI